MATKFHNTSSKENKLPTMNIQKKGMDDRSEPVPDITDLMNDWFFGSMNTERQAYNVSGGSLKNEGDDEGGKNSTSRQTQEWLHEAKRIVAGSPSRHGSPSRLVGSPRFAASHAREPSALSIDRRDPLARSARRHRSTEGISDEILSRPSVRHSRNRSESFLEPPSPPPPSTAENSPASAVHNWFSNILKPPTAAAADQKDHHHHFDEPDDAADHKNRAPAPPLLPPKQPVRRKSRFQDNPASEAQPPPPPPIPPRRTFRNPPPPAAAEHDNHHQLLLSPPKNLVESAHRRSISSSTCSQDKLSRLDANRASNPRRSVSVSSSGSDNAADDRHVAVVTEDVDLLNSFLKRQRDIITKISMGEACFKAKIILSGSSTSTTSSMAAAICYAWLLEDIERREDGGAVVVPVVNMKRGRMCKHKQAAWLFHHLGIDAAALLFSDEVDLEGLIMARQLSIIVIGQDVLRTNGEVGSQCTILTDNYCEDAYNLLQAPNLKKLLLAGILLDTQNLNSAAKFFTNRDAEAVQLLLVGSSPNCRNELFEQLMQDHRDNSFLEALRKNYGKPSSEDNNENEAPLEHRVSVRKSTSISNQDIHMQISAKQKPTPVPSPAPAPLQAPEPAPRGKNKSFFSKLFGFGSK